MQPETKPVRSETPIPSGSCRTFQLDTDHPAIFHSLFLHPHWAAQTEIEILIGRHHLIVEAPGWCYLPFTVGERPELREWALRQAAVLYQKERAELANFLNGCISRTAGQLPQPLLLIPGLRAELTLTNCGEEGIPPGPIAVLVGHRLTLEETIRLLAQRPPPEFVLRDVEA